MVLSFETQFPTSRMLKVQSDPLCLRYWRWGLEVIAFTGHATGLFNIVTDKQTFTYMLN